MNTEYIKKNLLYILMAIFGICVAITGGVCMEKSRRYTAELPKYYAAKTQGIVAIIGNSAENRPVYSVKFQINGVNRFENLNILESDSVPNIAVGSTVDIVYSKNDKGSLVTNTLAYILSQPFREDIVLPHDEASYAMDKKYSELYKKIGIAFLVIGLVFFFGAFLLNLKSFVR